jgi:hypothetical protein
MGKQSRAAEHCGKTYCRAYRLTTSEFERCAGEAWTQSFRSRLGLLATKLYVKLYGKPPKKVRSSTHPNWRNKVAKYPCGILEQAYRELTAQDTAPADGEHEAGAGLGQPFR